MEEFYKRSVFNPYLDYLLSALHARFDEHRKEIEGLACLIPTEIGNKSFKDAKRAFDFHAADLQTENEQVLAAQFNSWKKKWSKATNPPRLAIDALN